MAPKYPRGAPSKGAGQPAPGPLPRIPTPPPPGKGAPLDGGQSGGRK